MAARLLFPSPAAGSALATSSLAPLLSLFSPLSSILIPSFPFFPPLASPSSSSSSALSSSPSSSLPSSLLSQTPARSISRTLQDIWGSILKAVPKKKTTYSKKRSRFLAGKGLKDETAVMKCPTCGQPKRLHLLCPYCVEMVRYFWKQSSSQP